ncbi:MAG: oligosaccharide flippase family protein [bacterium]|nr:oligosaccharide flippase family protein [bacterium]
MKTIFRHLSATGLGMVAGGGFMVLFTTLAARLLGPDAWGVASVVLVLFIFAVDVINLSIGTTLIRHLGKNDGDQSSGLMREGLRSMFKIGVWTSLAAVLASGPIAFFLLNDHRLFWPLMIASISMIGVLILGFVGNVLQTQRRFLFRSILITLTTLLRVVVLLACIGIGLKTIEAVVFAFVLPPFLTGLYGLGQLKWSKTIPDLAFEDRASFHGQKQWMFLFFFLVALLSRIDTLLLFRFSTSGETGIYQAAQRMLVYVLDGAGVVSTVFSALFARSLKRSQVVSAFRQIFPFVFIGTMGLVVAIPFVGSLARLLYGEAFAGIEPVVTVLTISTLIGGMLTLPFVTLLLYRVGAARFMALQAGVVTLTVVVLLFFLIPAYGAVGAAITAVIAAGLQLVFFAARTFWFFKKELHA